MKVQREAPLREDWITSDTISSRKERWRGSAVTGEAAHAHEPCVRPNSGMSDTSCVCEAAHAHEACARQNRGMGHTSYVCAKQRMHVRHARHGLT